MGPDFFSTLDAGARVVIRYRLRPGEHGAFGEQLSDVLGYVTEVDDTHVSVETRGGTVSIERTAITHAKTVPPPPPRRQRR